MPPVASSPSSDLKDKQKKPRHRHSPAQLAALNELYERDEHPTLDLRVSLAERLGMETKTVNAWFQNKRASSKKRTINRPPVSYDASPINASNQSNSSSSASTTSRTADFDEYYDDEYLPADHHLDSASFEAPNGARTWSAFYAGNPEHTHFLSEHENMPRRMRVRPSGEQIEELKKLFHINPHPSTELRQELADRIGMRYQSITNWFQNQRSLAKKRQDSDSDATAANQSHSEYSMETRTYAAFPPPPPTYHPSLGLPPATNHPSLGVAARERRSLSPPYQDTVLRRMPQRRSVTPYGASIHSRPRRTRPEPYQLDALKDMYIKTAHPSIEERSALALEIGMDLGKVTNWFRNLRQTTRRRAKKAGSGDEDDEDMFHNPDYSASVSRSGSPSVRSSSESMDYDDEGPPHSGPLSDGGSEDEYEEAVTPSSVTSRSPPPPNKQLERPQVTLSTLSLAALDSAAVAEMEKVSMKSGIKVEDALLLLTFHQQVVR